MANDCMCPPTLSISMENIFGDDAEEKIILITKVKEKKEKDKK